MSAALGLYRLQQVDTQIDQAQARLKTIQAILDNDVALRNAQKQVDQATHTHQEAQRGLKQSETEVEKQRIKIEQAESSLYGGHVHNPKELQDLQKDVASLKRHLETLEERQLEAMLSVETLEAELQAATGQLDSAQNSQDSQARELVAERQTLYKDLETFETERQAVTSDLDSQTMSTYAQLRQQRRGLAVTTVSEAACSACGTTLTASQQQSARSTSQLFYCPSCGRILYAN